jgi:hypothetical protein
MRPRHPGLKAAGWITAGLLLAAGAAFVSPRVTTTAPAAPAGDEVPGTSALADPGATEAAPVASRRAAATGASSRAAAPAAARPTAASTVTASGAVGVGAPASAGMVVGIDPLTGRIGMPTPEQLAELAALSPQALRTSGEGLVEVHYPDGSVSIDLEGRFQEYAVARVGPDGKLVFQCVNDRQALRRALRAPVTTPAPAAEDR